MRNVHLTTIWGIPIRINVSLLVLLPVLVYLIAEGDQIGIYASAIDALAPATLEVAPLEEGATPWLIGLAGAVGLFFSVAVHELGHAYAARRYDIGTESITLWIFGGLAALESMPREWHREFWIAVAGPFTSLLLAVVFAGLLQVIPGGLALVLFVVGWLALINVVLAVFNMLPAFPMDGGRVLRALLGRRWSYVTATRIAARIGTIFALFFAVVGVLGGNPLLVLVALFVYVAATTESRTIALEELLRGVLAVDVMDEPARSVAADATLSDVATSLFENRRSEFVVTDDDEIVGLVTLSDLGQVDRSTLETTTVREVMTDEVAHVGLETPAFEVLRAMGRDPLVVVLEDGDPVGTVSRRDLGEIMQLRRELGAPGPFERTAM
ncbi:site-2 protease family protein [Natronobacterium gregoryi]|uniref:Zinc metalloprotease n=2 Tax=Natronobacterium gregoryi TaxID=44930 RepID=L0AJL0_NATGS|nr:site-2 protease family protein [Natronobacterium gregoryi]AFZ73609.1 Zn-dependent protease [Natronobacterium gregoryi SP2]ELY67892.1 peptidase M50 [Natronobacterium gregoryi SP2]PLK20002.1 site-2 protease family protein [Natronobacterium gregoryi SP2]SFJ34292.1 Zn-dependent protease (includes SpoIVFB) [Natronobacterium gregoryi]